MLPIMNLMSAIATPHHRTPSAAAAAAAAVSLTTAAAHVPAPTPTDGSQHSEPRPIQSGGAYDRLVHLHHHLAASSLESAESTLSSSSLSSWSSMPHHEGDVGGGGAGNGRRHPSMWPPLVALTVAAVQRLRATATATANNPTAAPGSHSDLVGQGHGQNHQPHPQPQPHPLQNHQRLHQAIQLEPPPPVWSKQVEEEVANRSHHHQLSHHHDHEPSLLAMRPMDDATDDGLAKSMFKCTPVAVVMNATTSNTAMMTTPMMTTKTIAPPVPPPPPPLAAHDTTATATAAERMKLAFRWLYLSLTGMETSVVVVRQKQKNPHLQQPSSPPHDAVPVVHVRTCNHLLDPPCAGGCKGGEDEGDKHEGYEDKTGKRHAPGNHNADHEDADPVQHSLCLNGLRRKAEAGQYQSLDQIGDDLRAMCRLAQQRMRLGTLHHHCAHHLLVRGVAFCIPRFYF